MLLKEESMLLIRDLCLYLAQWLTSLHTHTTCMLRVCVAVRLLCWSRAWRSLEKMSVSGQRGSLQNVDSLMSDMLWTSHRLSLCNASHTSSTLQTTKENLLAQNVGALYESSFSHIFTSNIVNIKVYSSVLNSISSFNFTITKTLLTFKLLDCWTFMFQIRPSYLHWLQ